MHLPNFLERFNLDSGYVSHWWKWCLKQWCAELRFCWPCFYLGSSCYFRVVEYSRNGFFDCTLSEAQKRTWFPLGHYFVLTLTDSRYAYVTSSNHWVLTATYFFQWASVELAVTYFSSLLWVTLLAMYSILQAAKLGWEYITVSNKTNLECSSTCEYSPALASLRRFFSLYFFKSCFAAKFQQLPSYCCRCDFIFLLHIVFLTRWVSY